MGQGRWKCRPGPKHRNRHAEALVDRALVEAERRDAGDAQAITPITSETGSIARWMKASAQLRDRSMPNC